jgi:hypothetical protein
MPKKKKSVYDSSYKSFASKYGISVLKDGKPKSTQQLTIDIYNYEVDNNVEDGLFPFLKIDW